MVALGNQGIVYNVARHVTFTKNPSTQTLNFYFLIFAVRGFFIFENQGEFTKAA